MPECAFCDHTGKLSNEHIVSEWMRALFPHKLHVSFGKKNWKTTNSVDYKAKTVCETCNNTWMSRIETDHAQPILTPLVTGKLGIPIRLEEARSIALFAYKTAIVLDYAKFRNSSPFFERDIRHLFKNTLGIPDNVRMWLCGYAGNRGGGRLTSAYYRAQVSPTNTFQMYVCTCAFGSFVFQVVAVKEMTEPVHCRPSGSFESLAVPFWHELPRGFVWPPRDALRSKAQFYDFAYRWKTLHLYE